LTEVEARRSSCPAAFRTGLAEFPAVLDSTVWVG